MQTKFIRSVSLIVVMAALAAPLVHAQVQPPAAANLRYPWDQRPPKCVLPDAMKSGWPCQIEDWPDFLTTLQRFQTLLTDPDLDAALIVQASDELGSSPRSFSTGEYLFEAFYHALVSQFYGADEYSADTVARWKAKSGGTGFAMLGQAIFTWRSAAAARGTGYASSVSPEAWKIYYEGLDKSLVILNSAPAYVQKSGPGFVLRLELTYAIPRLSGQRLSALDAAIGTWPSSAAIYGVAMRFAQPRWGGSFLQLDGIAQLAAKRTSATMGDSMYAITYEQAFRRGSNYLLTDSNVDWPRLKRAFADVERLGLGAIWLPRNFAELACQMRDKQEANRLFKVSDRKAPRASSADTDPCRAFADSK